jgi:ribosomal protein S18 acetylase RimI-like enzyme
MQSDQIHTNGVTLHTEALGDSMSQITIMPLPTEQTESAIGVLARAFVTNPLHVAAFGPSKLEANEVFFRVGLAAMKGEKFVAMDGGRILGVAHWVRSPACQFAALEKFRMMPGMVRGLGLGSALKVLSWVSAWSKHDPREPHVHLGPIAVEPEAQGRHVGGRLMEKHCAELDRTGLAGYLETDRSENVAFYARFGFVVTETVSVLGVENHFMRRG